MLTNGIQLHIKKIINPEQIGFIIEILEFQHMRIYQCNQPYKQSKEKSHMIILLDDEKALDKIQYLFIIKILKKSGIQGTYPNIMKAIYSNLTANTKINREHLKLILVKSGTRKGFPHDLQPPDIVLKVLASSLRQLKKMKGIFGKEIVKILSVNGMIVYTSDPKSSKRELLQMINSFIEVAR